MTDRPDLRDAMAYFGDCERCKEFMVALRWPDGVIKCPVCNAEEVTYLTKSGVWKCYAKHPKPRFSLKTGTIFEGSPVALEKWLSAAWMLMSSKNRVSSYELQRAFGVTQKTAWSMLHRLSLAMQSRTFNRQRDPDSGDAGR